MNTHNARIDFSIDELDFFASLSHDYNPLHMDQAYAYKTPFGQRVVFGILAVLKCLSHTRFHDQLNLTQLNVEFHNTIFVNVPYTLEIIESSSTHGSLELKDQSRILLRLKYERTETQDLIIASKNTAALTVRKNSKNWKLDGLETGQEFHGCYAAGEYNHHAKCISQKTISWFTSHYENMLLMLTSYLVGMEVPGKQALFSRLELNFHKAVACDTSVRYAVKLEKLDTDLGLLFLTLNVFDQDNNSIASANIQSFIRQSLKPADLEQIQESLELDGLPLANKTALVIGGSRGLGAALVQSLAIAGANVYLNYLYCDQEAIALQESLNDAGYKVNLIKGSLCDNYLCESVRNEIIDTESSLDIVICNACSSPQVMNIEDASFAGFGQYIEKNLKLVSKPLSVFTESLNQAKGIFCAISSIYVETGSKDFPQYVALKQAVEGLVKSASAQNKNVHYLLPRPPKLLTDMSNTPIGSIGAIKPEKVAVDIVKQILDIESTQANLVVMSDFTAGKKKSINNKQNFKKDKPVKKTDNTPSKPKSNTGKKICVGASFSIDLVLPSMEFIADKLHWDLDFQVTPYNQVFQELLSPMSDFNQNKQGNNLLFIRLEDWIPYSHQKDNEHSDAEFLKNLLDNALTEFVEAVQVYSSQQQTPLDIFICPRSVNLIQQSELNTHFDSIQSVLREQLSVFEKVTTRVLQDDHPAYDVHDYDDAMRLQMAHIPYTDDYFKSMGIIAIRSLFNYQLAPFKVIVLDCDNTLWKGVCDETGPLNVVISPALKTFQQFLIRQQEEGVLLCLCSKNREQAVWDVFDQHPDMLLTRQHLVDYAINWEHKSDNIKALAERLNLGLDSFIFIDDNPVECGQVRANLPAVLTLEMPQEEEKIQSMVNHFWVLDKRRVTQEDRSRTRLYQEDKARKDFQQQSTNFANFLDSLNIQLEFTAVDESNIARAAQLTKRTNQFNLSSIRRNESEILELIASGYQAFCVSVTDKFGDYGIVGMVLACAEKDHLLVDTFLLSCRVLGRGVEHRIVAHLASLAESFNLQQVSFHYVKSKKNEPLLKFLNEIASQLELNESISVDLEQQDLRVDSHRLKDFIHDIDHQQSENSEIKETSAKNSIQSANQLQFALEECIFVYSNLDRLNQDLPQTQSIAALDTDSHTESVLNIFSRILDIDADAIDIDDDLENLVDESYKIVDLTVALKSVYPEIPQTLLFETKNLREIINFVSGNKASLSAPVKISSSVQHNTEEEIAIIGINGLFPGANNINEFWKNLREGICSISDIPNERWDIEQYFSAEPGLEKTYGRSGGFITNPYKFDNQFFGISPREAETMDPQQRLFLQTVWGLLEDAGYTRSSLAKSTGVFLGVISSDYALNAYQAALEGFSHYRMSDLYQIPNRVSYYFDLHGPSLAIDSACSSSATALHLACSSLRSGECATAIVGGVNLITHPSRFIQYSQMQMISKSGVCSPFSDAADGTLFGEGVCALLLKPLSAALADGDNIHGVIKNTSVNSGGKTNGFTVPNPTAQAELIRNALVEKNIPPQSISYIEAHGTATNLGDPIEVRGLTEGFHAAAELLNDAVDKTDAIYKSDSWCALGSVKSNIGHLESCAALAGIIKCLMQMKHKTLVPSLTRGVNSKDAEPLPANSKIPFEKTPFKLQYKTSDWNTRGYPRRAGVSSFGAGGSNAHVILEEAPVQRMENLSHEKNQAVLLSAPSAEGLHSLASRLIDHLCDNPEINLQQVCYTLQTGREVFEHKLVILCQSIDELQQALNDWLKDDELDNVDQFIWYQDAQWKTHADVNNTSSITQAAAQFLDGKNIDWRKFYTRVIPKISLPGIEFFGKDFKIPEKYHRPAANKHLPLIEKSPNDNSSQNQFLGKKIQSPFIEDTLFASCFDLKNLPYLTDHRIYESVVVPGSLYVAYVLTLARNIWPAEVHKIHNLTFVRAMLPNQDQPVQLVAKHNKQKDLQQISLVSYQSDDQWIEHFNCQYTQLAEKSLSLPEAVNINDIRGRMQNSIDTENFYQESTEIGFNWGPDFQCVQELYRRDGEAIGRVSLPESLRATQADYAIHPAFLDACFQVFVPGMSSSGLQKESRQAYLPLGVNQVFFYKPVPLTVWSHVVTKDDLKKDSLTIDIYLYAEDGSVVAYFNEMQVLRTSREALKNLASKSSDIDMVYQTNWMKLDVSNQDNPVAKTLLLTGHSHPSLQETIAKNAGANIQLFSGKEQLTEALSTGNPVSLLYCLEPLASAAGESSNVITHKIMDNIQEIKTLLNSIDNFTKQKSVKLYLLSYGNQGISLLDKTFQSLGRVIALEYPDYWGGFIEIESEISLANKSTAENILNCLNTREDHFRISDHIQVPRLQKMPLPDSGNAKLNANATYLLTGAFGSLGKRVVENMLEQGARKLLFLNRKSMTTDMQDYVKQMEAKGASIDICIAELDKPEQLSEQLSSKLQDIKGVVHLAGLIEDGTFANLTEAQFLKVLSPKVNGTWNLHKMTQSLSLDFFILFSSASSLLGAAGQANYALANGFMDAFAHYRHSLGLTATSVNWGPWSESGMAADQSKSRKNWTNDSFGGLSSSKGLALFSRLLHQENQAAQIAILPYRWPELFNHFPVPAIPSILKQLAQTSSSTQVDEKNDADEIVIQLMSPGMLLADRQQMAIEYLREQVRKILGFSENDAIDTRRSFLDIGFDSLMAVSFRTSLAKTFSCYFPATLIFDYPNLNSLADYLVNQLVAMNEEAEQKQKPVDQKMDAAIETAAVINTPVDQLDISQLSQSELDALLESELNDIERILEI